MGKVKIEYLFLASAIYIVVTVLLLHCHRAAAAAAELSSGDEEPQSMTICNGDLKKLMFSCKKCIKKGSEKVEPKVPCCRIVQKVDLLCICQNIPASYYERKIDMEKVVFVAEKCEMPIPSGTKCGDYTVPII